MMQESSTKPYSPTGGPPTNADSGGFSARLRQIFEEEGTTAEEKIRSALRLGTERLAMDVGRLSRIKPGEGTRIVTEAVGPGPGAEHGKTRELSTTLCRWVVANGEALTIEDTSEGGWASDPATKHGDAASYLGAKVLVGTDLYGTVSFTGQSSRGEPFHEREVRIVERVAEEIGRALEAARQTETVLEGRHQVEQASDLVERMEALADVCGWVLDAQENTISWTENAVGLLEGIDAEQMPVEEFLSGVDSSARERITITIGQSIRRADAFTVEVPLVGPAGEEVRQWIELHGTPYARTSARSVGTVVGTVRDITTQKRRFSKIKKTRQDTIRRLAQVAEYRDTETGEHIHRVSRLSETLAQGLGAHSSWRKLIKDAAPLHDIGKIGIPDRILLKSGPLTDDEYERMKLHPVLGAEILAGSESEFIEMAARIARSHHERWDGDGYPDGIEGTDIPLEARVVAVADTIDAMTHDRPYRDALLPEEAFSTVEEEAGAQFDPRVAEVALENRERLIDCL